MADTAATRYRRRRRRGACASAPQARAHRRGDSAARGGERLQYGDLPPETGGSKVYGGATPPPPSDAADARRFVGRVAARDRLGDVGNRCHVITDCHVITSGDGDGGLEEQATSHNACERAFFAVGGASLQTWADAGRREFEQGSRGKARFRCAVLAAGARRSPRPRRSARQVSAGAERDCGERRHSFVDSARSNAQDVASRTDGAPRRAAAAASDPSAPCWQDTSVVAPTFAPSAPSAGIASQRWFFVSLTSARRISAGVGREDRPAQARAGAQRQRGASRVVRVVRADSRVGQLLRFVDAVTKEVSARCAGRRARRLTGRAVVQHHNQQFEGASAASESLAQRVASLDSKFVEPQ